MELQTWYRICESVSVERPQEPNIRSIYDRCVRFPAGFEVRRRRRKTFSNSSASCCGRPTTLTPMFNFDTRTFLSVRARYIRFVKDKHHLVKFKWGNNQLLPKLLEGVSQGRCAQETFKYGRKKRGTVVWLHYWCFRNRQGCVFAFLLSR